MHRIGRRSPVVSIARAVGVLAAALWLVPLVGALIGADDPGADDAAAAEGVGVGVLAIANVAAVAIAWRRPLLGGRLLLVTGTLFAVFAFVTAGRNEWLAVAVSGGPFLLCGVLLVVASRRVDDPGVMDATPREKVVGSG